MSSEALSPAVKIPSGTGAKNRLVAIAVAPNGGRKTKRDHPRLPLSVADIARDASECLEAGAAMLHLHVRTDDGGHLLDPDAYNSAIAAVKAACGSRLMIQITTESVGIYGPEEQADIIKSVRPEAASLALRELAPTPNDDWRIIELLNFMNREAIIPQVILYTPDDYKRLQQFFWKGLIEAPVLPVLFVLGRYASDGQSTPSDLLPFLQTACTLPWMMCAFGQREADCAIAAALLGGDVRIGFENNVHRRDGRVAADNGSQIRDIAAALQTLCVPLATADDLRNSWVK